MFSVGDPANPHPDDPRYGLIETAITAALEKADWQVVAVWEDSTGDIQALVFDGEVYKPE